MAQVCKNQLWISSPLLGSLWENKIWLVYFFYGSLITDPFFFSPNLLTNNVEIYLTFFPFILFHTSIIKPYFISYVTLKTRNWLIKLFSKWNSSPYYINMFSPFFSVSTNPTSLESSSSLLVGPNHIILNLNFQHLI